MLGLEKLDLKLDWFLFSIFQQRNLDIEAVNSL